MKSQDIASLLERLTEQLAAVEHERWSHWQRYVHNKAVRQLDGSLLLSPDLVARWEKQIETKYIDLSEAEKESDREQVGNISRSSYPLSPVESMRSRTVSQMIRASRPAQTANEGPVVPTHSAGGGWNLSR